MLTRNVRTCIIIIATLVSFNTQSTNSLDNFDVYHFNSNDLKASLSNTHITQTNDSLIYVANLSGVLEYDGSRWRKLELPGYSSAFALFYDDQYDLLYAGGTNEFGFFQKDSSGIRVYHSLRQLADFDDQIPDINQIIKVKDKIYFNTSEQLLIWDGSNFKIIPFAMSRLIKLGDKVFVSVLDKGVALIESDSLVFVNTELKWELEYPFGGIHLKDDTYLIGTYSNGIFTFNSKTFESNEWDTPASSFINKNYLADFKTWRDTLMIFPTYEGGLMIADREGQIINIIDENKGLNSNYLGNIFEDNRSNIWISGYYGIEVIRLKESRDLPSSSKPAIRFISVNNMEYPANRIGTIDSSPSDIGFHYSVSGSVLKDVKFSYYLEGYEQQWSQWSESSFKEYKGLRSGNYTFHVRAKSNNGQVSKASYMSVSIPVPWHENPLTYVVAVFCTVLVFALVYFLLSRRLKNQNRRLENTVNQRTSELLETNEELRITNTELDNFVYRSSHDLVAPLKSLKGLINIAQIDPSPESIPEYLEKMSARVSKLEEFIRSIMEYSINSKRPTTIKEVKLDDIIESVVEDIKYYKNAEKVELIKEYDLGTKIRTDEKRLGIILSNLITNAIKYHAYNRKDLYVKVTSRSESDQNIIQVIDNGPGIKEEYLENIFNMFFRASSDSEGSGLGLYIVRDMVDKLGGSVEVSSDVGKGTTFTIKLPV